MILDALAVFAESIFAFWVALAGGGFLKIIMICCIIYWIFCRRGWRRRYRWGWGCGCQRSCGCPHCACECGGCACGSGACGSGASGADGASEADDGASAEA